MKEKTKSKTVSKDVILKREDSEKVKKELSDLKFLNEILELRLKDANMNLSIKSNECSKIKTLLQEKANYLKYMEGDLRKKNAIISNLKSLLLLRNYTTLSPK